MSFTAEEAQAKDEKFQQEPVDQAEAQQPGASGHKGVPASRLKLKNTRVYNALGLRGAGDWGVMEADRQWVTRTATSL